jgi:hypothetical protein
MRDVHEPKILAAAARANAASIYVKRRNLQKFLAKHLGFFDQVQI